MTNSTDVFNFYKLSVLEQLEYIREDPEKALGILWYIEGYTSGVR